MTIASVNQMTNRNWEQGTLFPAEFFYPSATIYPHLHLSAQPIAQNGTAPWDVSYIGYHTSKR